MLLPSQPASSLSSLGRGPVCSTPLSALHFPSADGCARIQAAVSWRTPAVRGCAVKGVDMLCRVAVPLCLPLAELSPPVSTIYRRRREKENVLPNVHTRVTLQVPRYHGYQPHRTAHRAYSAGWRNRLAPPRSARAKRLDYGRVVSRRAQPDTDTLAHSVAEMCSAVRCAQKGNLYGTCCNRVGTSDRLCGHLVPSS